MSYIPTLQEFIEEQRFKMNWNFEVWCSYGYPSNVKPPKILSDFELRDEYDKKYPSKNIVNKL